MNQRHAVLVALAAAMMLSIAVTVLRWSDRHTALQMSHELTENIRRDAAVIARLRSQAGGTLNVRETSAWDAEAIAEVVGQVGIDLVAVRSVSSPQEIDSTGGAPSYEITRVVLRAITLRQIADLTARLEDQFGTTVSRFRLIPKAPTGVNREPRAKVEPQWDVDLVVTRQLI